jgi:hypothetical protein
MLRMYSLGGCMPEKLSNQDYGQQVADACAQYLSIPEFARRCGDLSPWTICSWLSKGKLTRSKFGSRTMIHVSELKRIVQVGGKSKGPRDAQSPALPTPDVANTTAKARR